MRAGEDLAGRHVALAVGVHPRAALDVQRHVGARGLDAQLARALQPLDERRLKRAQLAPRAHRVGLVEEQRALDERLEVRRGSCRPAGRRRAVGHSVEHQRFFIVSSRSGWPRAGGAREALGVDARERAGVLGRLDAELRVRLLRLRVARPRRTCRGGGRARGGSGRRSRRASRRAGAATRRARGSRAGTRAAAARRASSSARAPPGRAGRRGSSRRAGRRSARGRGSPRSRPEAGGAANGPACGAARLDARGCTLRAPALVERGERLGGVGARAARRAPTRAAPAARAARPRP